jgi:glycosyltransferase involved in cell wall biosynthesis
MDSKPLISIGIPTYNRPKGLKNVINDFLNQTYDNLEIIISDNNSDNPEVGIICDSYKKDSRIKVYKQTTNIGMFNNFEFVLSQASGKYFTWASDDDSFENNFIMECWKIHDFHENLSLVSPICRVFTADKIETMLYKPDFHTVGLNQLERMKKILFYIKKSHGALTGLYKTRDIKKIKLKTILDADGLLLYELSSIGEFYQLKFPLVKSNVDYVENETKTSLTYEKEKFVKTYKMQPYFMWLKHEKITLFFVFAIQSIKTNTITTSNKIRIIPTLFRSFFGKNRFKLLSMIKTICFYFRRTKIGFIFCMEKNKSLDDFEHQSNQKSKVFFNQKQWFNR